MEQNLLSRLLKIKQVRLTRKLIEQGAKLPKGYGFAWRDFDTATTVAYLIPFNVLFRELRRLWHWIVSGYKSSVIDEAYLNGYRHGKEDRNFKI